MNWKIATLLILVQYNYESFYIFYMITLYLVVVPIDTSDILLLHVVVLVYKLSELVVML